MLYLAQVQNNQTSGEKELCLLAYQKADQLWQICDPETISCQDTDFWPVGNLVLVKFAENKQIIALENAKDWVIDLLKNHLSHHPLTPEWIENEKARIEQGRQEITAKSLDLTRRQLELETQREQIQELESQLKKEQSKLEKRHLDSF